MQVRYNPIVAYIMLGLGLLNLGLGLWLLMLGSFSTSIIIGVVVAAVGMGYLNRPYFYVEDNQIVLPALLGPVKRTFSFATSDDLRIENNRIQVNNGRNWKRVPVYRWLSHGEDWKSFLKELHSITE